MTSILSARGLGWTSPHGRGVLKDASLNLLPGEIVLLQGASGAGKTVLGTLLLRLRPLLRGSLHWGNHDVTSLSPSRIRPLRQRFQGLLQHAEALLPEDMTVGQCLTESAQGVALLPRKEARRRISGLMDRLPISSLLPRLPRTLSGGEQRMVSLARVLLVRPCFAFLDEPDTGLDPLSLQGVVSLIEDFSMRDGTAFLWVTHHPTLHHALPRARRLMLKEGRLHEG